jgi:fumarate hydratase class I
LPTDPTSRCKRVVDEGVRRAYLNADNKRAPRSWPIRLHLPQHPRQHALRSMSTYKRQQNLRRRGGQGRRSENKSKFKMMNPERLDRRLGSGNAAPDGPLVPAGHAGHRHRRHRRALRAARQEGPDGADRHGPAQAARPQTDIERLRIEIFDKVNALGIGAQGLGGLSTILDVKIMDAPATRRASLSP